MRLALLSDSGNPSPWIDAIARSSLHELAAVIVREADRAGAQAMAGSTPVLCNWEELLHFNGVDGVVLSQGKVAASRDDQLRKLVQAGLPLLVEHPACAAIVAFEVEMIRTEMKSVVLPYCASLEHPFVSSVDAFHCDTQGGKPQITQVTLERKLSRTDRENVLAQFAEDALLMRRFIGDLVSVNASGAQLSDAQWPNLAVMLTGTTGIVARWSVLPGTVPLDSAQLRIWSKQGETFLEISDPAHAWSASVGGKALPPLSLEWNARVESLKSFGDAVGQLASGGRWMEAARCIEAAECVEASLRRSRTIPLYNEEINEEGSFKGVMAMAGCGVLIASLIFLLVGAVVQGVYDQWHHETAGVVESVDKLVDSGGQHEERTHVLLRLWPAYPFLMFLALQLFRLVFWRSKSEEEGSQAVS